MKVVSACQAYVRGTMHSITHNPVGSLDVVADVSRRYFFTLAFISLFFAKLLHLYAHLRSLTFTKALVWGSTFFFQDVVLLLLVRIFAQKVKSRPVAVLCALFVGSFG